MTSHMQFFIMVHLHFAAFQCHFHLYLSSNFNSNPTLENGNKIQAYVDLQGIVILAFQSHLQPFSHYSTLFKSKMAKTTLGSSFDHTVWLFKPRFLLESAFVPYMSNCRYSGTSVLRHTIIRWPRSMKSLGLQAKILTPCTVHSNQIKNLENPRNSVFHKKAPKNDNFSSYANHSIFKTDHSFGYASPCLWNQLPLSLRQSHSGTSSSISNSPIPSCITSSSVDSPLWSYITPSLFHSKLKTYLFHKSYHRSFTSSAWTAFWLHAQIYHIISHYQETPKKHMYDTIWFIYVCSKADQMASLIWHTTQKRKIRKTKNKNIVPQKKWSGQ